MSCGQLPPDPKWYPSTCYNYDHKKFLLEHGTFPEDSVEEISVALLILGRGGGGGGGRLCFFNILCALECVSPNSTFQMHFLINVNVYIPGTQYVKKGGLTWTLWSGSMLQYSIQRSCDVTTMCILGLYTTVEGGWMQHRSVPQDLKEEKQSRLLGMNMLNTHLLNQEIGTHWRKKNAVIYAGPLKGTLFHTILT